MCGKRFIDERVPALLYQSHVPVDGILPAYHDLYLIFNSQFFNKYVLSDIICNLRIHTSSNRLYATTRAVSVDDSYIFRCLTCTGSNVSCACCLVVRVSALVAGP